MSKITHFIAISLLGATASVHAADRPFAGVTWGESKANFSSSSSAYANTGLDVDRVIDETDTWSLHGGLSGDNSRYYGTYEYVSGSHGGANFRLQALNASYDRLLPITSTARLFGGATVGVNYLSQIPGQYSSDRDWGLNAGLQAGVLQDLGDNLQLELGYRYSRYFDTKVDLAAGHSDARLNSGSQPYLGLSYRF